MKKIIAAGLLLTSIGSVQAGPESFGSVELGIERITYRESLSLLGKDLSQDSTIYNPVQHTLSYTALRSNKNLGFYLESSSTLFENIATEHWSFGEYNEIQSNDFSVSSIDVKLQGAYNVSSHSQIITGFSFFTLDFTRSSTKREAGGNVLHAEILVDPNNPSVGKFDDQLSDDLKNGTDCDSPDFRDVNPLEVGKGFCTPVGAISESQNSVEYLFGYIYDSKFSGEAGVSWYAQADLALPIWHRTVNSKHEGVTLSEFGGGWGINTRAGVRVPITDKVNFTAGMMANYKTRAAVTDVVDGRDLFVPEIKYTNIQFLLGFVWYI